MEVRGDEAEAPAVEGKRGRRSWEIRRDHTVTIGRPSFSKRSQSASARLPAAPTAREHTKHSEALREHSKATRSTQKASAGIQSHQKPSGALSDASTQLRGDRTGLFGEARRQRQVPIIEGRQRQRVGRARLPAVRRLELWHRVAQVREHGGGEGRRRIRRGTEDHRPRRDRVEADADEAAVGCGRCGGVAGWRGPREGHLARRSSGDPGRGEIQV